MSATRAAQQGRGRPLAASQASPLGKLGSWSYRHRRLVAITWVVALVVTSLAGRLAGSAFKNNLNGGTPTPSQRADSFLHRLDRTIPNFLSETQPATRGHRLSAGYQRPGEAANTST